MYHSTSTEIWYMQGVAVKGNKRCQT